MKTIRIPALIVIPALLASGCGTICNLGSKNPEFYGGIQKDVTFIQTPSHSGGDSSPACTGMVFLLALVTADAGLSLVADTLTLPVVSQMRYRDPAKEEE